MLDEQREEIVAALERVQNALDDMAVRGVRSAGKEQLTELDGLRAEFERIGAGHMAERIGRVADASRNDEPHAASALFLAQTSVRLFERVLTLEVAGEVLEQWIERHEDAPLPEESP